MSEIIMNKNVSSIKIEYILLHNPTKEILEITSDLNSIIDLIKFNNKNDVWKRYGLTNNVSILSKVIHTKYCIIDQTKEILG